MNAGMGVVHSERPPSDIQEHGGVQEIIQLWVNLPKAHKMNQPEYIPLQAEDTPVLEFEGGRTKVRVVAGVFDEMLGPIKTPTPILALRIEMEAGATSAFPAPPGAAEPGRRRLHHYSQSAFAPFIAVGRADCIARAFCDEHSKRSAASNA